MTIGAHATYKRLAVLSLVTLFSIEFRQYLNRPHQCETTYIYEGYVSVDLPETIALKHPRYKLFRYADGDPSLAKVFPKEMATARATASVPLLFVHGHLGSHQQMRSMASENSRELARRLRGNDKAAGEGGHPSLWVDWFSVDFGAEPSAFQAFLMEEQVQFTVAVINHLHATHTAPLAAGHKMVILGYSMGGIVARAALQHLAAAGQHDVLDGIGLFVSLAAPNHHLPAYMTPRQPSMHNTVLPTTPPSYPVLHIVSGAADYMVPGQSGRHGEEESAPHWLTIDMEDVPGVWCSTHHKSAVSCNQLVRKLAPVLIDAAVGSGDGFERGGVSVEQQVENLKWKLTTHGAASMSLTNRNAAKAAAGAEGSEIERGEKCSLRSRNWLTNTDTQQQNDIIEELEDTFGVYQAQQAQVLKVHWSSKSSSPAVQDLASDWTGAIVIGLRSQPCYTLSVAYNGFEVAWKALPLPPLLPSDIGVEGPRYWQDILKGIDWMQNATSLVYIPFTEDTNKKGHRLDIALAPLAAAATPEHTVMVQLISKSTQGSLLGPVLLKGSNTALHLNVGHAAVLHVPAPQPNLALSNWLVPISTAIFGRILPWKLDVHRIKCSINQTSGNARDPLASAYVALSEGATAQGDTVRYNMPRVPLWHPGISNRKGLLVTDPRCQYSISMSWDVLMWLVYSMRAHGYCMISLVAALSMVHLLDPPLPYSWLGLAVLSSATASHWPHLVASIAGVTPWMFLALVEAVTLFSVALGVYTVVEVLLLWVLIPIVGCPMRLIFRSTNTSPFRSRNGQKAAVAAGVLAVALSTVFHPSLPHILGILILLGTSSTNPTYGSNDDSNQQRQRASLNPSWLLVHICTSFPGASWLAGWAMSERGYTHPWNLDRWLLALQGVHATVIACVQISARTVLAKQQSDKRQQPPTREIKGVYRGVAHVAAALAAAYGICGYPYVTLYAVCVLELCHLGVLAVICSEKKHLSKRE